MIIYVVVGILTALALGLALYGWGQSFGPTSDLEERLELWVGSEGVPELAKDTSDALLGRVERTIAKQSFGERIKTDLARADLALTVSEYLFIRASLVAGGIVLGVVLRGSLLIGLLLGAVAFGLPMVYVRSRQAGRLRAFNGQLPDVLDQLVGSLRAGYGLLQAVEWLARQLPHPAGSEFDRVVREAQLGSTLPEALDSLVRRIASDDLALIVTAIKIQYEVGGKLADVLETVAYTIRERVRIQREIRVLTAQQRYSGYTLMVLPIALGIVLFLINPEYEAQLFAPGPTICIPIGTAIMMVIGFFVMRRIVDIDV
jgi:tight adherence protein B